jgi:hypothetical protein
LQEIDRRQFVKRAGIGVAGAGALWVAPSMLGFDAAFAGPSCLQKDTLDYSTQTRGSAPASPVNYNAVGIYPRIHVATALGTINSPTADNGTGGNFTVQNFQLGANNANKLCLDMNNDAAGDGYTVTYTWTLFPSGAAATIYNLAFTMYDVDSQASPGFIDTVYLTWTGAATINPTLTTLGSYVQGAGTPLSPWTGDKGGDHNAGQGVTNGNIGVQFSGGLSQLVIHYYSGNILGSEQYVGISNLTWCR